MGGWALCLQMTLPYSLEASAYFLDSIRFFYTRGRRILFFAMVQKDRISYNLLG